MMRHRLESVSFLALLGLAASVGAEEARPPKRDSVPAVIGVRLVLAKLARETGEQKAAPIDLSKPGEEILAQIADAEKQGRVSSIQRFQLTTTDSSTAQVQFGENVPAANGLTFGGPGKALPIYEMMNAGTMVFVTPRLNDDQTVTLSLTLESSRLREARMPGSGEPLEDFRPAGTITSTIKTTLRAPAGKPTLVNSFETSGESDAFQHIAIVTAGPQAMSSKDR